MQQKLTPVLPTLSISSAAKKNKTPKLQLVEAKLKFFVKWLQSESEALFELIHNSIYFLFLYTK